jgi:3-dehydroquinate synthase
VQEDVLEAGKRAFLNFGHTFGHALEKSAGYGTISHGEAVFVGMLAACYTSQKMGAEQLECTRFEPFMPLYHIELEESVADIERLVRLMARDKKVQDEVIRLILLEDWGKPILKSCEDVELLKNAWNFALEKIRKV